MIVLITGGYGAIGRAIAHELRDEHEVIQSDARLGPPHLLHLLPPKYDVLINASGYNAVDRPTRVVETNLLGAIQITAHALAARAKTIVHFSGAGVGMVPALDEPPEYIASKAGLVAYVEAMAARHPDVAFHVLAPGKVASKMTRWQGQEPKTVVPLIRWLISEPRLNLSGRLLSVKHDSLAALENVEADNRHLYRLRRIDDACFERTGRCS